MADLPTDDRFENWATGIGILALLGAPRIFERHMGYDPALIFGGIVAIVIYGSVITIARAFFPMSEEWIAMKRAEAKAKEEERRLAKKSPFPKKKVMFGLWEREMTLAEKFHYIAMGAVKSGDYESTEKIVRGLRGSGRGGREHDDRKASLIDVAEVLTRFRCVECDTPMEGGPYKGTNLCPHCGFMFDSKGNAINPK